MFFFKNGAGDPLHNGDPLHPGGLVNFHFDAASRKIVTNGDNTHAYSGSLLFPDIAHPYHSNYSNNNWVTYGAQQEGEIRLLAFELTRDCYYGQGEQFSITDFDLPLIHTIRGVGYMLTDRSA